MTDQERQMELLYPFSDDTMFREKDGSRMPWYTPDAIRWIKENIPSNVSVLEFGGGHSTLWWRKRANQVTTVEYDQRCALILEIPPMTPTYYLDNMGLEYDVVVIDGEGGTTRQDYIERAFSLCEKYFIVDNWQQPDVCIYDEATVKFLYDNTKEQNIFPYPHNGWQTAIFVK